MKSDFFRMVLKLDQSDFLTLHTALRGRVRSSAYRSA